MPRRPQLVGMGCAAAMLVAGALSSAPAISAGPALSPGLTRSVLLPTGERVLFAEEPGGRTAALAQMNGAGGALLTYNLGSDRYVVPVTVARDVGTLLDPALFDIGALAKAEAPGTQEIGVQVFWDGTSAPAMPWLLRPHQVTQGETDGIISALSGPRLERDLQANTVPGIRRIQLPGSAAAPPPAPDFKMYTVTVRGLDAAGQPDTGDTALVTNVDNEQAFTGFDGWYHGIFKISAPRGHYSAIGTFFTFSKQKYPTGARIVIVDFTVTGVGAITIDARAATAQVTVATPLAVASGFGTVTWLRNDSRGDSVAFGNTWQFAPGLPPFTVRVSPTAVPKVGLQAWTASYHLDSSPAIQGALPYSYDLAFGTLGAIAADQHNVVTAHELATFRTRYFSDVPNRLTIEFRSAFFPWQFFGFSTAAPFAAPLERTEYVQASPEITWLQNVFESPMTFGGNLSDSPRVFRPGEQGTLDWGRGPIGPGVPVPHGEAVTQYCPACTEAGALEFLIYPFGGNPPGHQGTPNPPMPGSHETDAYTLYRDGAVISSGPDPLGVIVPVPPGQAHYRLLYTVAMRAPWWTLSTRTITAWTFLSPQSMQSPLPSGWDCASGSSVGCTVVALMVPDYVMPLTLTNSMASGQVTWELGIQHILDIPIPVTSGSVSISSDGGHTWLPAVVRANNAGFRVSYSNPAGPATVSIRIHITDAAGGVLDQTNENAYAVP